MSLSLTLKGGNMSVWLPALPSIMRCARFMTVRRAFISWVPVTLVFFTMGDKMMWVLVFNIRMLVRLVSMSSLLVADAAGGSCERVSSITVVPRFSSLYRRVMTPPVSSRMSFMMVLFGCMMKAFGSYLRPRVAAVGGTAIVGGGGVK